jgi:hypothetical protein
MTDGQPWWFHYIMVGSWLLLAVVAIHGALFSADGVVKQYALTMLAVVFTGAAALWSNNMRREVPTDE